MTTPLVECVPMDETLPTNVKLLSEKACTEEFLATLGHEMRNPLGALSNALQVWPKAKHDPVLMEELRCVMLRQVHQLSRLSDDLADGARIAQGTLVLRRERVALRRLIDDACEVVRPFIDQCGHALTVTMPDEPMMLYGDADRLLQVFANLIQNAAKFTDRSGSLSVTVEHQERTAVVRVRDNGRGIEERMLPELFEAFTQAEAASKSANDGLGIGLRLVKTIVELHGGAVAVRSRGLGRGSEFSVHLPLMSDAERDELALPKLLVAEGDGGGPRLGAHRILVVDDDRASAELLARMLRSLGQTVTVADNGALALRTVMAERPQVVFLDIVMRAMDGCEVARQIRANPELAGLALFALSGNADEQSKRRALDAGFDKYLVKPTSIAALAEMLAGVPATT